MEKLHAIKYFSCPQCQTLAIVLSVLETEKLPEWDEDGNLEYYCIKCHVCFSVNANGDVLQVHA